jgi:hypothetical protein
MKRLFLAIVFPCLLSAKAEAHFEQSALVVGSRALGGAFVSRADDPSAIFVNPAGMTSPEFLALYVDYGEPAGVRAGNESRLALVASMDKTRFGLGWYRFGAADGESENLLIAGAARKLIEGTPGSFLSIGANTSVGGVSVEQPCCGTRRVSWSKVTGDIGLLVKPLPVISIAYAVGNILNEHHDITGDIDRWSRAQRWGVSYFWEERIVLSFEEVFFSGATTLHYGFSFITAVPIELMAGFSDGNTTGGIRWLGKRFRAAVAFSSDEERGITWSGSCEIAYRGNKKEGTE